MLICHTADLHFSNNDEKRKEVVAVCSHLIDYLEDHPVDAIVIAGDLFDEMDGRIRVDSDCWTTARDFVQRAASFAPALIVRGTPSHDRNTPAALRSLSTAYPVFVATEPCQVRLLPTGLWVSRGLSADSIVPHGDILFSCLPSPEKVAGDTLAGTAENTRTAVHDVLRSWGDQKWSCPHFVVAHGMLDGASYGGATASLDQEFSVDAFQLARPDGVMLGHVHRAQEHFALDHNGDTVFPVIYSGSLGRLNFGETEDKSFVIWETSETGLRRWFTVPSPARRFVFGDLPEWSGANNVYNEAICMARGCQGAYVRLRYVVPEEERQSVNRGHLEALFGGAASVKIEVQVIPKQRVRAAGISRVESLADKVCKWGETVDIDVPDNVLGLASIIEGKDAEELLQEAMAAVAGAVVVPVSNVPEQADLFAEAA